MSFLILWLLILCFLNGINEEVLENDEIPLTGERFVRKSNDNDVIINGTHVVNQAADNPFAYVNEEGDFAWVKEGLKEIAHYLRMHKFNEYDRRYEKDPKKAPKEYYKEFPRPPLRSLHWEVRKFCEPSFLTCVEYLTKKIKNVGLKREDDTSVAIQEQKWNEQTHANQIKTVEEECKKLFEKDYERADPFEGPIERFQWRVTASYYMCWYTMNEVPNLANLNDTCDNFASCLDPNFGARNKDPRAEEGKEFNCALYSFCPDPCCPIKHIKHFSDCWQNKVNPCHFNTDKQRECKLQRSRNVDFNDIILNHWNVSCHCPEKGFEWKSKYGICVDINECATTDKHLCKDQSEACVNTKGSYMCACNWGYTLKNGICQKSPALDIIKKSSRIPQKPKINDKGKSVINKLYQIIVRKIKGVPDDDESSASNKYHSIFINFLTHLLTINVL